MAEIPALTAARALAVQTDAVRLREQQEEARARLDLLRQQEFDRRNRDIALQQAADQRRLEQLRNDLRAADETRAFLTARDELRAFDDLDREFFLTQKQIEEEILDARAFRADAAEPRIEAPGRDLDAILAPAVEAPEAADDARERDFRALEDARDARLAERRDAERDAAIQQRIDLRLAEDRIPGTPPAADLPRGSIVDVVA